MLNKIVNYYRRHRRDTKQNIRTNYTRPMKNALHCYKIQLINQMGELKSSFFQLKNLRFIGYFVIVFWLFRDFAFADDTTGATVTDTANGAVQILNGLIFIIALIAQPLVMLIGWLLSPDWTFGDIIGLRKVIHDVWIIVSNIVYFIFAIMLIVIALMNIFSESKSFALKSALPRLVVGILMVPFTWFIVSATLSVTNVLTASVLSFSYETIIKDTPDTNKNSIVDKKIISSKIYVDLLESESGSLSGASGNSKVTTSSKIDCDKTPDDCRSLRDILSGANGSYNLLTYYAYGIFRLDKLKDIGNEQVKDSIKSVGDIFKKLTFGAIFTLVFAILVIAIAFALFTRMAMMWVFAMFSPLFALSYFLGGKGPKGIEKIEKKLSIKAFISLAMVPVYVSAALSFGLIFLSFAMNGANYANSEYIKVNNNGKVTNGEQSFSFGKEGKDVQLIIKGKYAEGSSGIIGDTFDVTGGIISNVIISFLALIILWIAVMAALGASDITEKAVKPIAEFGDSIGKLMVDAPKYIPIKIPGTDGKSISMAGLGAMGSTFTSNISSAAETSGREYGNKFGQAAANALGMKTDEATNALKGLESIAGEYKGKPESQAQYVNKLIDAAKLSASGYADNNNARNQFAVNLEKVGIKEDLVKQFRVATKERQVSLALKAINDTLNGGVFGNGKTETDIEETLKTKGTTAGAGGKKSESNTNTEPKTNTKPTPIKNPKVTNINRSGDDITININGIKGDAKSAEVHEIKLKLDDKMRKDDASIKSALEKQGITTDLDSIVKAIKDLQ